MSRQDLEESGTQDVQPQTARNSINPPSPLISVSPDLLQNPLAERVSFRDSTDFSSLSASDSQVMITAPLTPRVDSGVSSVLLKLFCGAVDFVRIAAVTQTLMSRWLHQLFLELERYDAAPPKKVQETWLGYPIMGSSALLAVLAKTLNAVAKGEDYLAAEDYLFTLFSSSLFYFFMDLVVGAQAVPLGVFIAMSSVALPLAGAFFLKLMSPDSDDKFYFRSADLEHINSLRYVTHLPGERLFNAITGVKHGGESLTVLCWMINREVHGRTVALPSWEMGLVGVGLLLSAKMGYDLTDNPIRFQKFMMLTKFFQDAALSYAAFSGIFYMLFSEKSYFDDTAFRAALVVLCTVFALGIGTYSGATTRFRFEDNVEGIEGMVSGFRSTRDVVGSCLTSVGDSISGFFASCCKEKEAETVSEHSAALSASLV